MNSNEAHRRTVTAINEVAREFPVLQNEIRRVVGDGGSVNTLSTEHMCRIVKRISRTNKHMYQRLYDELCRRNVYNLVGSEEP